MNLHNTIIYLIGIPAVGKYTVAKEIGRITGAKVVDNQLINTPIYSVVVYDGTSTFPFPQGAGKHIETIRRAVLTVIRDFCPQGDSFVFTNVLDARAPGDKALFRRIERLAKQRKAGFFPVWLTCNAEMLLQRKNTQERRARLKDIDLTTIPWYLQEFEVLKVQHPKALTLDTSHCGPEQTARRILEHVQVTIPAPVKDEDENDDEQSRGSSGIQNNPEGRRRAAGSRHHNCGRFSRGGHSSHWQSLEP